MRFVGCWLLAEKKLDPTDPGQRTPDPDCEVTVE
jgi:hypothetical protein